MVGAAALEGFLKKHRKIGLDSSILIYFIQADLVYGPLANKIFEWMEAGRVQGICSALTLLEVLVQPYRRNDEERVGQFYGLLTTYPHLTWVALSLEIADLGARLRATYRLKTPDSILIATALNSEATGFIGNDADLKRVTELDVLVLGK
ncbi:MAG: PIN domain-containing protein [Candidatus Rokubacteria bacterium]|nr:PIN domain-containing protein [Candidatus Rokubacteria bacterium]MBI2555354.1 PIN domain-containing protein [Candidatus Rokubacteria bacterium]